MSNVGIWNLKIYTSTQNEFRNENVKFSKGMFEWCISQGKFSDEHIF